MDWAGQALDNVYIERFFRTIKYKKIYLEHPETGHELYRLYSRFINYYNEKRNNSSIEDVTPIQRYIHAA